MRASLASRMPLRGASRGTPARSLDGGVGNRTQEAAARALSIGSGAAAGAGNREPGSQRLAWGSAQVPRRQGYEECRRAGRCWLSRARGVGGKRTWSSRALRARSCAERREDAIPTALFPRNGSREPAPGPPASPLWSRGSAGKGTPTVGSFEGFPFFTSSPGRRGPGGDAGDAGPRHRSRAAAEACPPVPRSSLLRTSPGSGSKIPNRGKKEKARGRGRCGLGRPPSPPVGRQQRCYWRRGAARGKWGGGALLRGVWPDELAPEAAASPPGEAREEAPQGAHDLQEGGGCSFAHLRALPAF